MRVSSEQGQDIWEKVDDDAIVIPTNLQTKFSISGDVNSALVAVMGAGLARQAAERYPGLAEWYAQHIVCSLKNFLPVWSPDKSLILLPTKDDWRFPSNYSFVRRAIIELASFHDPASPGRTIRVPLLGCGLGGLDRVVMQDLMGRWLGDRFLLVDRGF